MDDPNFKDAIKLAEAKGLIICMGVNSQGELVWKTNPDLDKVVRMEYQDLMRNKDRYQGNGVRAKSLAISTAVLKMTGELPESDLYRMLKVVEVHYNRCVEP